MSLLARGTAAHIALTLVFCVTVLCFDMVFTYLPCFGIYDWPGRPSFTGRALVIALQVHGFTGAAQR